MSTQFKKRWAKSVAAAAVSAALWAVAPAVMASGDSTGAVVGVVQTTAGQAVIGATVNVRNTETGLTREIQTDASGNYRFPQLPLGSYEVTVSQNGKVVAKQAISVRLGGNVVVPFDIADSTAETIEVVGARPSAIDLFTTDSGLVLGEADIDRLPVGRNTTEVALLAPGVVRGDSGFGNLPSFSGATVGENVYYINGFNLTNFRNGLGGSTVPFEFYKEFQVKTGGFSAEFGRSTGGVVNAVSKSGTNDFQFDIGLQLEPKSLRSNSPNTIGADGKILYNFEDDTRDRYELNLSVGGPIIQDKLFFFALYNPRNIKTENPQRTAEFEAESDDAFWGGKLDWYIADGHNLEMTIFSDKTDFDSSRLDYELTTTGINTGVLQPGGRNRNWTEKNGGTNTVLKYTGNLSEDFTLQVLYGKGKADSSIVSGNDHLPAVQNTYIRDQNTGIFVFLGRPVGPQNITTFSHDEDERTASRVDAAWYLGESHKLKFGMDNEKLVSDTFVARSGGVLYEYRFPNYASATPSQLREHLYLVYGTYTTKANAFYIEDEWQINDEFFVSLGLRNEHFKNENFEGDVFVDMKDQWGPRLAASWDVMGDGSGKLYANIGRYFLPVANNTNVRLAGNELFVRNSYSTANFTYVPNGVPVITGAPSSTSVFSDGHTKPAEQIVDQEDLDPMYQDEFILGYNFEVNETWAMNVRAVYRDLGSTLEDVAIDHLVCDAAWQASRGITAGPGACDHVNYILVNPGTDVTVEHDFDDGNGPTRITMTADELQYPESERKYKALEVSLDHKWDGKWAMSASYTWSNSYGNNEGYVRSDNDQDDAGLTTLFDYPGLMEGAYGDLPNDRTHQIKVYGAYGLTDSLTLSYNASAMSGRPKNCFGVWDAYRPEANPADFAWAYGVASFYCDTTDDNTVNPTLHKRGSFGRTDNVYNIDLGIEYKLSFDSVDASLRMDIFNVFDWDTATEVQEEGEFTNFAVVPYQGVRDPNLHKASNYQSPRTVRLGVNVSF